MKVNLIFLIVKTIYIKVVKTTTQHFVDWHLKGRFLKSFLEAFSPFPEIEFTKEFPPSSLYIVRLSYCTSNKHT